MIRHPELYKKKIEIVVNNAISNEVSRLFHIISRNVIAKNKISFILEYDGMVEYYLERRHIQYKVID